MIENGFAAEGLRKCVCNTNLLLIKYIMTICLPIFFFNSNDEFGDVPVFPQKRGQRDIPYFFKYLDREFEQLFPSLLNSCRVVPSAEPSSRTK